MVDVLTHLEPRYDNAGTLLINELDEHQEIYFVMKGTTLIGYDMNKERHYCVRKKDNCIIGAFGLTFRFRSTVVYYAKTRVEGYFIRKENWL